MELRVSAMCSSRAPKSKVRYLAVPSGTVMDEECVKAANEHGIVFALTSLRF
jgi:phosphoribosylaminoimidazolecarboxamide formyltransferase/IMP cyclohydrolase